MSEVMQCQWPAHKPGFWSGVRDFLNDNNGTMDIEIRLGDWMPAVHGSCGPPPDVAAIINEPYSVADVECDRMELSPSERKHMIFISKARDRVAKISWLMEQARESSFSGSAPMDGMTQREQSLFLKEIDRLKKGRVSFKTWRSRMAFSERINHE